jgi:hypothetical protein
LPAPAPAPEPARRGLSRRGGPADYPVGMALAVSIVLMVVTVISLVFVGVVFIWAAKKDGEEQDALDARLGRRRRRLPRP